MTQSISMNHLQNAVSPYLQQHASNPVDWHEWGDEAFEFAKQAAKPVFLSIGYATCHWCHVMAHESFEDLTVAKLLNETFVCIKVDREERPDIDSIYMSVCQMLTGQGGWPLTILLTPDRKPFFAATYLPKESRYGRPGMLDFIPHIQELWLHKRNEALVSAEQITAHLQKITREETNGTSPGEGFADHVNKMKVKPSQDLSSLLESAYRQLAGMYDQTNGGFGRQPKFPTPHNLLFLLRYWQRTKQAAALLMTEKTLQAMRAGGLFDHIGFGFHRYSTDQRWFVPHFEKMLYDQALLLMAYTEAYQATGKAEYRRTAEEIGAYVRRDLTHEEGGFFSAEDADSEGEEGKFYLWTKDEIEHCLPPELAGLFCDVYQIIPAGNYADEATGERTGGNIPHLSRSVSFYAEMHRLDEDELRARLEKARQLLFSERTKRLRPLCDDKILTDWNGLMIAALAKAGQALTQPDFIIAAEKAADFIVKQLTLPNGRLLHRFRAGQAGVSAFADDYAFLIWGLLELYEATFRVEYLENAIHLTADMMTHFWDEQTGGFFQTPADGEALLVRRKEIYDGALPSVNSVAMLNLYRLNRMTGNPHLAARADQIGAAFAATVEQGAAAYTQFLVAVDFATSPSCEIVIVGDPANADTQKMAEAVRRRFLPNKVMLLKPKNEANPTIIRLVPYLAHYACLKDQATAYVCQNFSCQQPTTDIETMMVMLNC